MLRTPVSVSRLAAFAAASLLLASCTFDNYDQHSYTAQSRIAGMKATNIMDSLRNDGKYLEEAEGHGHGAEKHPGAGHEEGALQSPTNHSDGPEPGTTSDVKPHTDDVSGHADQEANEGEASSSGH